MLQGEVLITGGSGAMGRAIIHRAYKEKWDCKITVFSRDVMKQHKIKSLYPNVGMIVGDIRDFTTLSNAMVGKDIVLHLAAQKHIPEAEYHSIDNYEVNVIGSMNVCAAASQLGVPHVLGISTDKVAHPANAYGCSKLMMEKVWQEYARIGFETNFHLVRFGNVLESTGSVLEVWKNSVDAGKPIIVTDPAMTRFFISPQQAVDLVVNSLKLESGMILIPKMKALSIQRLAEYWLEKPFSEINYQLIPLRPGEKMHESLLTIEECKYAVETDEFFFLHPSTSPAVDNPASGQYSSDMAEELTKDELVELLKNE